MHWTACYQNDCLNQQVKVMIDSVATGNFMDPKFKKWLRILGIKKMQPESILGLNGEDLGGHLTNKLGFVPMAVMGHFYR